MSSFYVPDTTCFSVSCAFSRSNVVHVQLFALLLIWGAPLYPSIYFLAAGTVSLSVCLSALLFSLQARTGVRCRAVGNYNAQVFFFALIRQFLSKIYVSLNFLFLATHVHKHTEHITQLYRYASSTPISLSFFSSTSLTAMAGWRWAVFQAGWRYLRDCADTATDLDRWELQYPHDNRRDKWVWRG